MGPRRATLYKLNTKRAAGETRDTVMFSCGGYSSIAGVHCRTKPCVQLANVFCDMWPDWDFTNLVKRTQQKLGVCLRGVNSGRRHCSQLLSTLAPLKCAPANHQMRF